jgi:CBS domain-containing protein
MKTVRQILGEKGNAVHTIAPDASVFEALQRMAQHDVGALVVLERGELAGLISERDYARKIILVGKSSKETRVREIMSTRLVTVDSQQRMSDCMSKMTQKRIRHLPVLENGQLAGIISIGDVVKAIIEDQQSTIEELEHYITGTR